MLLLQCYTILFAAALAWLNKIPCRKMIDFGASIREEKEFHKANAVVKVLFVAGMLLDHFVDITNMIVLAVLLLLEMWVVFDCVLGKLLHNDWFYIGQTAKIDKWLNKHLGEYAGIVKPVVVGVVVLIVNFYL